jgi:hypothetical protein
MPFNGPRMAHGQAGALRLSVAYGGQVADELGVDRVWFSYRVEETIGVSHGAHTGRDLRSSAAADVTARTMVGALASFLADAGERYRSGMRVPDEEYPAWLYEAAYVHGEELAQLADAREVPTKDPAARDLGAQVEYVSVVFQDGTDADEALALLEREGPAAAVAHLARWDYGEETDLAAHAYGHVYSESPAGRDDRTYADGEYVLSWNPDLWHIGLSRKVGPVPAAVGAEVRTAAPVAASDRTPRRLPPVRLPQARRDRHERSAPAL